MKGQQTEYLHTQQTSKNIKQKLEESEERYKILVQTIPDIIYEVDAKGRFTFVSAAIKRLGYNPKELIGKHFSRIIHPDDFEAVSRAIVLRKYKGEATGNAGAPKLFDERRTGEKMTKSLEVRLMSKDQRDTSRNYFYMEVNSSGRWDNPLRDKNGTPCGVSHCGKKFLGSIGIIRDITERKETEEALTERMNELIRSEKFAFTGRVAASIAHEIRNPLTNVIMSIRQFKKISNPLRRQSFGASATEDSLTKHIDMVARNTERINFLITELLNCARPPKLDIHHHNIHTVLRNILRSAQPAIKRQNIKVDLRFTPQASIIEMDREQMGRALSNIVINAIEAMPKGGKLTIVTELRSTTSFVVKIQDTGEGIPQEDIIRIYDPFFTTKPEGVGLGLTLCYGVILSHGGTLEVESKPKEGTLFTVSSPVRQKKSGGGVTYG